MKRTILVLVALLVLSVAANAALQIVPKAAPPAPAPLALKADDTVTVTAKMRADDMCFARSDEHCVYTYDFATSTLKPAFVNDTIINARGKPDAAAIDRLTADGRLFMRYTKQGEAERLLAWLKANINGSATLDWGDWTKK